MQQEAIGQREPASQPAAQRRQRRKHAQPQLLSPQKHPAEEQEASLAPTELVEGAAEEAAATSFHGTNAAVPEATLAAPLPAVSHGSPQYAAAALQQANAMQADWPQTHPEAATGGASTFQLLQEATDVAAAAAGGLTPELAAAFVMLLPLDGQKVRGMMRFVLTAVTAGGPAGWG